jgi:hypothetical protein
MKLERLLYRYGDRRDSCRQCFAATIILLTPICFFSLVVQKMAKATDLSAEQCRAIGLTPSST